MLFLPSNSPAEVEALLDLVDWYAKRHGTIRFELDRHPWSIACCEAEGDEPCAACHRRCSNFAFTSGARVRLCCSCARKELYASVSKWHWPFLRTATGSVVRYAPWFKLERGTPNLPSSLQAGA
jgi:hypothetical protein